jgi:3-oxoacyl-[acyl-carrier-protein] synthase-1
MRRVAITGVGVLSSIGNSYPEVIDSLRRGRSGVSPVPEWVELGLRCTIAGQLEGIDDLRTESGISGDQLKCMSDAALYCALAAQQAVGDAGLTADDLEGRRTGCVVGSGISGTGAIYEGGRRLYSNQLRRVRPYVVLNTMASSCSANLATLFKIGGRSYSISSACTTSAHCIGHGFELIRAGQLDLALVGGGEEVNALVGGAFDAMRMVLSTHFNHTPSRASRPFDVDRDGFVLAEGAGILILEDMERAVSRGAHIRGEIIGYAANSGGTGMVHPETDGRSAAACIHDALLDADVDPESIDYVNAHGTSTNQGDLAEARALRRVFGEPGPPLSSTKSMTGHALGAIGAHELIFCLAMLEQGFIAPSLNIDTLDPEFEGLDVVRETRVCEPTVAVSNSFGFGGTNAVLVVRSVARG